MGNRSYRKEGTSLMHNNVVYIRFFGQVNLVSANMLMERMEQDIRKGVERFVIVLSSRGGDLGSGVSVYNFLKGVPAEVVTQNFGDVQSSALVLFCGGIRRLCVPNGSFLYHAPAFSASAEERLDKEFFQEQGASLETDRQAMLRAIADSCGKKIEDVEQDVTGGKSWNSEQAKDYGLVHEIQFALFEKGAQVFSITSPPV